MPSYSPVQINPSFSQLAGFSYGGTYGVFVYNNALYAFVSENDGSFNVYTSTNQGTSWAALNAGHGPPASTESASAFFDGDHTLFVIYGGSPFGLLEPLTLLSFDLATGLWGSVISTSPSIASSVISLYKRVNTDSAFVVIFSSSNGAPQTGTGLGWAFFAGGGWLSGDLGVNITSLSGWDDTQTYVPNSSVNSCMEADNNTVHVVFRTSSSITTPGSQWDNLYFYQSYPLGGVGLGSFFQFPGQQPASGPQDLVCENGNAAGAPCVVGSKLVIPFCRTIPTNNSFQYPTVYVGTPLSNPVWTVSAVATGIDPNSLVNPGNNLPFRGASLSTDGINLVAAWQQATTGGGANPSNLRLSQTSNLADPTQGWVATTAFTGDPTSGSAPQLPQALAFDGQILLSSDLEIETPFSFTSTWFGNFTPVPPSPTLTQPVRITLRGAKLVPKSGKQEVCCECPTLPHMKRAM